MKNKQITNNYKNEVETTNSNLANQTPFNSDTFTSVAEVLEIDVMSFSKETYNKITSVMGLPAVMMVGEFLSKLKRLKKFRGEMPELDQIKTKHFRYVAMVEKKYSL